MHFVKLQKKDGDVDDNETLLLLFSSKKIPPVVVVGHADVINHY